MWDQLLKNKQKLSKLTTAAFDAIDINNDNKIQQSQLQQIMVSTADNMQIQKPTKQQVKQIMKQLDKDSKGYLTKDDFTLLVEQVLKIIKKTQQN